jgi:hypothetical protein
MCGCPKIGNSNPGVPANSPQVRPNHRRSNNLKNLFSVSQYSTPSSSAGSRSAEAPFKAASHDQLKSQFGGARGSRADMPAGGKPTHPPQTFAERTASAALPPVAKKTFYGIKKSEIFHLSPEEIADRKEKHAAKNINPKNFMQKKTRAASVAQAKKMLKEKTAWKEKFRESHPKPAAVPTDTRPPAARLQAWANRQTSFWLDAQNLHQEHIQAGRTYSAFWSSMAHSGEAQDANNSPVGTPLKAVTTQTTGASESTSQVPAAPVEQALSSGPELQASAGNRTADPVKKISTTVVQIMREASYFQASRETDKVNDALERSMEEKETKAASGRGLGISPEFRTQKPSPQILPTFATEKSRSELAPKTVAKVSVPKPMPQAPTTLKAEEASSVSTPKEKARPRDTYLDGLAVNRRADTRKAAMLESQLRRLRTLQPHFNRVAPGAAPVKMVFGKAEPAEETGIQGIAPALPRSVSAGRGRVRDLINRFEKGPEKSQ